MTNRRKVVIVWARDENGHEPERRLKTQKARRIQESVGGQPDST